MFIAQFAHQWGSVVVAYGGSGSSRVHVAEQTFCLSEGNASSSVTHLERDRETIHILMAQMEQRMKT